MRSIVPIVGHHLTEDAALLEVAYYAENVLFPGGRYVRKDLVDSMLKGHPNHEIPAFHVPTAFQVYAACPDGFMHPKIKPKQSSGGGGHVNTVLTEDYVLRYPKCRGPLATTCDKIPQGTKCNNCGWTSPRLHTCQDTLAHEHGHTLDLQSRRVINESGLAGGTIDQWAYRIFGDGETLEGPAHAASMFFMNPASDYLGSEGRKVMTAILLFFDSLS